MTIGEILKKYYKIEIELLLAHVLKKPKEFLYLNPKVSLSAGQLISLSALIRRRQRGEPVAYILGYKDFMGLRFKVNKNVLIPRPETEQLVERVGASIPEFFRALSEKYPGSSNEQITGPRLGGRGGAIRILDVGTGSGCIIISLAKILHNGNHCGFYGSDISKEALKIAKENAKIHKVKIKFKHSDILENVRMSSDIIIANLPYGWSEWKNNSSMETKGLAFEPKQALFSYKHGLGHIEKLLIQISKLKIKPKLVYLEFDPRQKKDLQQLIKKILLSSTVKFYKDLAGHWRVAEIKF